MRPRWLPSSLTFGCLFVLAGACGTSANSSPGDGGSTAMRDSGSDALGAPSEASTPGDSPGGDGDGDGTPADAPATDDGAESAAPDASVTEVRLVHLGASTGVAPAPNNLCAWRHGDPQPMTPLFSNPPTYGQMGPYLPIPPGTYDFRLLVFGTDCTSDAAITSDGLTDVVVSGPMTLTIHVVSAITYGMYAFADTGTPTSGMANVRMHNDDPKFSAATFTASLLGTQTPLGSSIAPNAASAMVSLPPGTYVFQVPDYPSNALTLAAPQPSTTAGTWDGFAFESPGNTALAVCPTSTTGVPVTCAVGY